MQYNHTNYHSHCNFCDGRGAMEEFVKAAIECHVQITVVLIKIDLHF